MSFKKLAEITAISEEQKIPFWQVILEDDMKERGVTKEESMKTMESMLDTITEADEKYDASIRSASGMAGGDGGKIEAFRMKGNSLIDGFILEVIEKAVKMGESNACMKRIVAMPTAGSCGVIEEFDTSNGNRTNYGIAGF